MIPVCAPPPIVIVETGEHAIVPGDAEGLIAPLERYGVSSDGSIRSRYAVSGRQVGTLVERGGEVSFSPVFSLPKKIGPVTALFHPDPNYSWSTAEIIVVGNNKFYEFDITGRMQKSIRIKGRFAGAFQDGDTIVVGSHRQRGGLLLQGVRWGRHLTPLRITSRVTAARGQWLLASGGFPAMVDSDTRSQLFLGTIPKKNPFSRESVVGMCGNWLVSGSGELYVPSLGGTTEMTLVGRLQHFFDPAETCSASRPRTPLPGNGVACTFVSHEGTVIVGEDGSETVVSR